MKRIRELINKLKKFEEAAIDNANKGGGDPAFIPSIEEDYSDAKYFLIGYIAFELKILSDLED